MSEEQEHEIGDAVVHIRSKDVYKAVRNILANEMKLDPEEIRREVQSKTETIIQKQVLDYLNGSSYWNGAALDSRVRAAIDRHLEVIDKILREQLKILIGERLNEQMLDLVGGILKDGLTVNLGWNRKIKVKVQEAPKSDQA